VRAGRVEARVQPHGHPHGCCAVLLPAVRRRRLHDIVVPPHVQRGQQDAMHDGQPDPRVVAAHGARAPVRVGRCAHDWGGEAARRCGAVGVVRGGGDGSAGEYLLLQLRARLQTECAEEVGKGTGDRANASAVQECVRHGMDSLHAVVGRRSCWRRQRPAVAASALATEGGVKESLNRGKGDLSKTNKALLPETKNELLVGSEQELEATTTTGNDGALMNSITAIMSPQNGFSDQEKEGENNNKQEEDADDTEEEEEEDEEVGEDEEEEEEEKNAQDHEE
ncbi:mucin-associated surface protein (MASP), putative, partial [Trypanosoma cruzi marinkellei]